MILKKLLKKYNTKDISHIRKLRLEYAHIDKVAKVLEIYKDVEAGNDSDKYIAERIVFCMNPREKKELYAKLV